MPHLSTEEAAHSLLTLIAQNGNKAVIIPRSMISGPLNPNSKFYHEVSQLVTEKFAQSNSQGWIVTYITKVKCFVAVQRSEIQKITREGICRGWSKSWSFNI